MSVYTRSWTKKVAGQARTYWPCLSEQLPQELFCDLFVQVAHVTCSLLIPILCMLADQISTYSSRDAPPRRSHIVYCDYVYLGSKKVRSCHSYVLTSLFTNAQVAGPFIDCACQWQEMRTLNMSPSSQHGRRPSTHVRRMTRLRQAHRMTRAETWRHAVSMPGMIWKILPRVHQPHMDVPFGAIRPFNSTIIYRLRAYTMSGLPHTHTAVSISYIHLYRLHIEIMISAPRVQLSARPALRAPITRRVAVRADPVRFDHLALSRIVMFTSRRISRMHQSIRVSQKPQDDAFLS